MKKNAISILSKTKVIVFLAVVAIVSFFSTGCTPTPTPGPAGCSTTNTNFQQIYNGLISSGYHDDTIMDTKVHEYTFRVNANETVCKVGYKSQPADAGLNYTINLIDSTAHTQIFSVTGAFSTTATSYISIPNQVPLPAGHVFVLQRIAPTGVPFTQYNIGRLARSSSGNVTYPVGNGTMAIVATNFYDTPGQTNLKNFGVPYIDLVFQ